MENIVRFTTNEERLRRLRQIEETIIRRLRVGFEARVFVSGFLALMVSLLVLASFDFPGVGIITPLAMIAVFISYQRYGQWPMLFEDKIASLVISYGQPLNEEALNELKAGVAQAGYFEPDALFAWVEDERRAIGTTKPTLSGAAKDFLDN